MKNILLFDNESDPDTTILRDLIKDGECHVIITDKIDRALFVLEGEKIDLVIANILMSHDAAFDVLNAARHRGIKTFVMTGLEMANNRQPLSFEGKPHSTTVSKFTA